MADADHPSDNGILKHFEVVEWIVDLLSGVFLLVLFGPFVYALSYAFPGPLPGPTPPPIDPVIDIFPGFLKWIDGQHLGTFTPWLLLAIALALGTMSRGVIILYNLLRPARWLEKRIAGLSLRQIDKWHKLSICQNESDSKKRLQKQLEEISSKLIDKNPFHRVGDPSYAKYRADLLNEHKRHPQKEYWYYEMPLFLRSEHYYWVAYTFFWSYLLYGIIVGIVAVHLFPILHIHVMSAQYHFDWPGVATWIGILILTFLILIGLFEEVILHGAAFLAIDHELYENWTQAQGGPSKH